MEERKVLGNERYVCKRLQLSGGQLTKVWVGGGRWVSEVRSSFGGLRPASRLSFTRTATSDKRVWRQWKRQDDGESQKPSKPGHAQVKQEVGEGGS